ncbi:MAG: hypothetical protein BWY72_02244 [Bacteroidetes bacterium ADurb.Bin416]|nr:MAG: hypothetical protein BWY72_02244 [Bacteroidetes bacterium ADurb.Bin416]
MKITGALGGKPEAITTYYGAGLENAVVANHGIVKDFYTRVEQAVMTDAYVVSNIDLWINLHIVSDDSVNPYITKRANVGIGS